MARVGTAAHRRAMMPDDARARAVIAEDEPLQRALLRSLLADQPRVEVVAEAGDGVAAVEAIREHRPDLLFLDVQMPELDAFGVIDEIGLERMPVTIFVTAYDQYALKAFEVHALDFLLKPFDGERLGKAVRRALDQLRRPAVPDDSAQLLALLAELRTRGAYPERLPVRSEGRVRFVDVAAIDWIEAAGKHVRIHAGPETHELRETMASVERKLDPRRFLRIHRSTIVHAARVKEVQPWFGGDYVLILRDGTRLQSGRGHRDAVVGLIRGHV